MGSSWIVLKYRKLSYPVDLMKYARDRKLGNDSAFVLWVPYILKNVIKLLQRSRVNTGNEHMFMASGYWIALDRHIQLIMRMGTKY